jgi:hypothetical protein
LRTDARRTRTIARSTTLSAPWPLPSRTDVPAPSAPTGWGEDVGSAGAPPAEQMGPRAEISGTPRTSIGLIERTDQWGNDATSMPGRDASEIEPAQLRPGDFVTVTTDDDHRDAAVAMQVIRPESG